MGLFSQFWARLGEPPRSGHKAVNASRCGEAIQLQAIWIAPLPAQHGGSCPRQYRSFLPHLDQAEFGQNKHVLVADWRHFQPTGLNVPQRPTKTDSSFEIQFSEGIVNHALRLLGHLDQMLSAPRRLLVRTR
jgi:hypothetical protein